MGPRSGLSEYQLNSTRSINMGFITADTFKTKANRAVPSNFKPKTTFMSKVGSFVKYYIYFSISLAVARVVFAYLAGL